MNKNLIVVITLVMFSLSGELYAGVKEIAGRYNISTNLDCDFWKFRDDPQGYLRDYDLVDSLIAEPITPGVMTVVDGINTNEGTVFSSAIVNRISANRLQGKMVAEGDAVTLYSASNAVYSYICSFRANPYGKYEIQFDNPGTEYHFSAWWTMQLPPSPDDPDYTVYYRTKINKNDGTGTVTIANYTNAHPTGTISFTGISNRDYVDLTIEITAAGNGSSIIKNSSPFIKNFNINWSLQTAEDGSQDQDNDQLTDSEELILGTDKFNADSDYDGRSDWDDPSPLAPEPNQCNGDIVTLPNGFAIVDCRVTNSITTQGDVTVESGEDVLYMALSINLAEGFHAEPGSVFHAVAGAPPVAP